MVDDLVGGTRTVDADQHIGAPGRRDLPERGVAHRDVIAGGERPGVARAQHHREAVTDVGAPRGQGMKPETPLACPRHLGLGTGGLDQGGVQPDHQHRTPPLPGPGSGPGQVLAGDLHRQQPPMPGHRRATARPARPAPAASWSPRPHPRDRRSPPGRSSPRRHSDTSPPRPANTPRPPTPDPDAATEQTPTWPSHPPARCTTPADQPATAATPPRPPPPSPPHQPRPTTSPTTPARHPQPPGDSLYPAPERCPFLATDTVLNNPYHRSSGAPFTVPTRLDTMIINIGVNTPGRSSTQKMSAGVRSTLSAVR